MADLGHYETQQQGWILLPVQGKGDQAMICGGPYFHRQRPAPCGHYYPDVVRIEDRIIRDEHDRRAERLLECVHCGDYWMPIPLRLFSLERIAARDELSDFRRDELVKLRELKDFLESTGG